MPEPLPADSPPWITERARRDPTAPALRIMAERGHGDARAGRRDGERMRSFGDVAASVEELAARLTALGVRAGDRVALLMESSARMVELLHATQRCLATVVPLNTRLAAPEVAAVVADAAPRLVLHDRELRQRLALAASPGLRFVEAEDELDRVAAGAAPPLGALDPAALHTLVYTSGTTGAPKGVMLTHANHAASAAASRANLGVEAGDHWLAALPLYHVGGLSIVLRAVLDGVPVTVQPRFDPARVRAAIRDGAITLLSLVPTMLHRLLEDTGAERFPPSALRAVLIGGAAASPALLARARAAGLPVLPTYGLTEAASQVTTASPRGACPRTAAGMSLPGTEIRIADPDAHGCGEILVRGPTVMAGYFQNPAATAEALRGGWLHTGDLGRVDDGGFLHVLDRRSDLVVSGGENVYPAEVEAVLAAHPDVDEAAVHGRPHPVWGHELVATIVTRDGRAVDAEALGAWCRARLAGYKVPRSFRRVAALPRTPSGKLRRHLLSS